MTCLPGGGAGAGRDVDGISCQASEQTIFHIHAHLTIFMDGSPARSRRTLGSPSRAQNGPLPVLAAHPCPRWRHPYRVPGPAHLHPGRLFDEWGQPLSPDRVGPATGRVVAIYNGQRYEGNPRDIPLNAHAQIQLEVDTPLIAPESITFPSSL